MRLRALNPVLLVSSACVFLLACNPQTSKPVQTAGSKTDAAPASTFAPKQDGQLCLIEATRCESFNSKMPEFRALLEKNPALRNPIEDATVDVLLSALAKDQQKANAACRPATSTLRRIAALRSKNGLNGILMGSGKSACTLIVVR